MDILIFVMGAIDWSPILAVLGVVGGLGGIIGVIRYSVNSEININTLKERDREIASLKREIDEHKDEIRDLRKSIESKNDAILKLK